MLVTVGAVLAALAAALFAGMSGMFSGITSFMKSGFDAVAQNLGLHSADGFENVKHGIDEQATTMIGGSAVALDLFANKGRLTKAALKSPLTVAQKGMKAGGKVLGAMKAVRGSKAVVNTANAARAAATPGNIGGALALGNSAFAVGEDAINYASGEKELNQENIGATNWKALEKVDPVNAVASLAETFGADIDADNINIYRGASYISNSITGHEGTELPSEILGETAAIYAKEKERWQPRERDLDDRLIDINGDIQRDDGSILRKPLMTDYYKLAAIKGSLKHYLLHDKKLDGYDLDTEFDKIDMSEPKNYVAYGLALSKMMSVQANLAKKNVNWSWVSKGASAKFKEAQNELNFLEAVDAEFGLFEARVDEYNAEKAQILATRSATKNVAEHQKISIPEDAESATIQHNLPPVDPNRPNAPESPNVG